MRCFETLLENIETDRLRRTPRARVLELLCPLPVSAIPPTASKDRTDPPAYLSIDISDKRVKSDSGHYEYFTVDAIKSAIDKATKESRAADGLSQLRRRIAARLHPDRGLPESSEEIMAEANALIDRALVNLKT